MRILQLRKWLSVRDDNGGKMRASGLARALAQFAAVDAIGFSSDGAAALRASPRLAHYDRLHALPLEAPARRAAQAAAAVGRGGSLRSARFASPRYRQCVAAALGAARYDAVQVEELSMLANLGAVPAAMPIVYSAHNVESDLAATLWGARAAWLAALAPLDRRRTVREERRALRRARLCLAVSDADRADLQRLHGVQGAPIHVVPNCADDDVAPLPPAVSAAQVPRRIVFTACYTWAPNAEGARWFLAEVWPLLRRLGPPCAVDFVGSGIGADLARAIGAAGCAAHGDVPDVRPHLAAARVAMVPLRSGSGTRLKIVEAWASGIPVVSTSLGAAGLAARGGADLLLADDPAAFAAALGRVLGDDALYDRLRGNGLERAAPLRWARQGTTLAALYAELG